MQPAMSRDTSHPTPGFLSSLSKRKGFVAVAIGVRTAQGSGVEAVSSKRHRCDTELPAVLNVRRSAPNARVLQRCSGVVSASRRGWHLFGEPAPRTFRCHAIKCTRPPTSGIPRRRRGKFILSEHLSRRRDNTIALRDHAGESIRFDPAELGEALPLG